MKYIGYLLLILSVGAPSFVHAETVVRIGDDISVSADQVVNGDYYVSAGPVGNTTMSGEVDGDMYAFGGAVTVNGIIKNDLVVVGGTAQVHAPVGDDVRVLAGEVTIADHVSGDVFVIGGILKVLSTATIDGDVIFFGGTGEINGNVTGSILGTSEQLRVDAKVGGNVDVTAAKQLTLGDKAAVDGYVSYTSVNPIIRAQLATVGGEVNKHISKDKEVSSQSKTRSALIPIFITLFATLSLFLLFKKELQTLVENAQRSPAKSALFGVSLIVLGPIAAVILMVTVLGIIVGMLCAGVVLIAYMLGFALSGVVFGAYLSKWLTKKTEVSLMWVIIGTVSLQALLYIPVIGFVIVFTLFIITVGGLAIGARSLLS